ncbi:peptide ABC transporter permease [Armatimonadota bacterium]|nr:peptide ABC transporter permease [Armatimonadota bacterium]
MSEISKEQTTPESPLPLLDDEQEADLGRLSYRQLVWRKFRKSRLAVVGGVILVVFYTLAIFAEFFAPYDYQHDNARLRYVPPQTIRFFGADGFHITPFIYGLKQTKDPETTELIYVPDKSKVYPVHLFHHGDPYRFMGLISTDIHLIGSEGPFYLIGTDRMGRDIVSRIIYGGRVSLTVGLVGVFLSIILGSILGTVSGYWGGLTDTLMQRFIELLSSFPTIPLWMALAAALPSTWSGIQVYMGITVILSLLSWGGLARQVRGKVLATREQDYVLAARAAGASHWYILMRHLLPTAYSHIIVIATLSIPGMILGETALSFLGLGIRPPLTSWGVLLEEAQRVTVVLNSPWLLIPSLPVVLVVIAYNFVGDALRDAADPYAS